MIKKMVTVFVVCSLALVVSNVKSITTIHSWTNGGTIRNLCESGK